MAKVFVMKCAGLGILLPCVLSKLGPGYFSWTFDIFSPVWITCARPLRITYIFHFIQGGT